MSPSSQTPVESTVGLRAATSAEERRRCLLHTSQTPCHIVSTDPIDSIPPTPLSRHSPRPWPSRFLPQIWPNGRCRRPVILRRPPSLSRCPAPVCTLCRVDVSPVWREVACIVRAQVPIVAHVKKCVYWSGHDLHSDRRWKTPSQLRGTFRESHRI